MFQAAGDTLRVAGKFFLDFFVLCGLVRTNTHTFGDPLQNPDKTAPNWQIFVRTKLATCLANIIIYNPLSELSEQTKNSCLLFFPKNGALANNADMSTENKCTVIQTRKYITAFKWDV